MNYRKLCLRLVALSILISCSASSFALDSARTAELRARILELQAKKAALDAKTAYLRELDSRIHPLLISKLEKSAANCDLDKSEACAETFFQS